MTLFTDAYTMALLPRSTRRALGPGDHQLAVMVTQDGLDLSLSTFVYKAINAVEGLVDTLRTWHERRVAIRRLLALDNHILKDIGLHHGDVLAMAGGRVALEEIMQNRYSDATSVASTKNAANRDRHEIAANDNELASAA